LVPCDSILDAQVNLGNNAPSIDVSTGSTEPIRPVRDGSLITTPLNLTAAFPMVNKPILLSNVKNEAGPTISGMFTGFLAQSAPQASATRALRPLRCPPFTALPTFSDTCIPLKTLGTDWV
jgi:hypothetical protein